MATVSAGVRQTRGDIMKQKQ